MWNFNFVVSQRQKINFPSSLFFHSISYVATSMDRTIPWLCVLWPMCFYLIFFGTHEVRGRLCRSAYSEKFSCQKLYGEYELGLWKRRNYSMELFKGFKGSRFVLYIEEVIEQRTNVEQRPLCRMTGLWPPKR